MPARAPRAAVPLLALLAAATACSAGTEPPATPRGDRPGTPPVTTSRPASPSPPQTRTPLAVAHHPSRGRLALTREQAQALADGTVTDWRELGAGPAPLRLGSLADVRADRDAVAVLPAAGLGPAVAVARVDGIDPLRNPAAYPLTTAGPEPPVVTTVTVGGDVMMGRRVGARLAAEGDPVAALRPLAPRLAAADLTVVNLESTLSRSGAPRQGGDSFGASPAVRQALRVAGVDVVSLANNHTGDYGPRALVQTVRRVRAGGFESLGAGADLAGAAAPVVVERNDVTFGLVAFDAIGETPAATATRPGALRVRMQPRTGPLNQRDLARVTGTVGDLRASVDVVMVLAHWGTQYTHDTVRDQRRVARALVDAGADVVVGGHPHWVQGVEVVDGSFVAYSLGNLVFDMDFMAQTQEGVLLELAFWGDELKGARLAPYVIGGDFAPRLARGSRGDAILGDVWRASGRPLRGTHAP